MFVGREHEITEIQSHYSRMCYGNGSVLFLTGEAGLGKTTLVHEWWENLHPSDISAHKKDKHLPLFVEAVCSIPIGGSDVGGLEALQPWADVLTQLHGIEKEGKHAVKFDLKRLITEAAPSLLSLIPGYGTAAWIIAEGAVGIRDAMGGGEQKTAASQQQIFQQYANLLSKISERHPLVLFLDDMHWADASSCNLLFHLSRHIADKKLFIVATYRVEDALAAYGGKGHPILSVKNEILRYGTGKEIPLTFLGRADIRLLLNVAFPEYTTDDRFELWLQKISDGNALFVSQYLQTLNEDGHLNAQGAYTGDYAAISIPQSALAVVEERTRRLDEATRELLCYATAEGEEFTTYVLSRLAHKEPLALLRELKKAEKLAIIKEKGTKRVGANKTTTIFGFSHALFHKALYNALSAEERDILHNACLELLREEWENEKVEISKAMLAPKLLVHAEKCGHYVFGAEAALHAAHTFWGDFSGDEAIGLLEKIFEYGDIVKASDIHLYNERFQKIFLPAAYMLRGTIDDVHGQFDSALEWFGKAGTLAAETGDAHKAIDAANGRIFVLIHRGEFNEVLKQAELNFDNAGKLQYQNGMNTASNYIGIASSETGDQRRALECFQRTLEASERNGDAIGKMRALNYIGNVLRESGDYTNAKINYDRCIELSEALGARLMKASALNNKGTVCYKLNDYDDSLNCYEKSLSIYETVGDAAGQVIVYSNKSVTLLAKNRIDSAYESLMKCLEISRDMGSRILEANVTNELGNIANDNNDFQKALFWYQESLKVARTIGLNSSICVRLANIGWVYRELSDTTSALKYFEESVKISKEQNIFTESYTGALRGVGEVKFSMGEHILGIEYVQESLEVSKKIHFISGQIFSLISLGILYQQMGDFQQSKSNLDESLTFAVNSQHQTEEAEARGELGKLHEALGDRESALKYLRECVALHESRHSLQHQKWKKELERVEASA